MIPIVIPSYEPDERLIILLKSILAEENYRIVIVNDGSGSEYNEIFEEASHIVEEYGGIVLFHDKNYGKGHALKTAFDYIIREFPNAIGCVTADSDGQHDIDSIRKVISSLNENVNSLVLGVRSFDKKEIPWKSYFGNQITKVIMKFLLGISVSDTQTGLRGIPIAFMRELLDVKEDRFEFETQMLILSSGRYPVKEVPIKTIYDSKENHSTHFNPFKDSFRIYRVIGAQFFRFIVSSLSSSIIDLGLFTLFCVLLRTGGCYWYIFIATVAARILSATYNFAMNYSVVFKSKENKVHAIAKYVFLALIQMIISAVMVNALVMVIANKLETVVKIVVDSVLFLISYFIQKHFVFR